MSIQVQLRPAAFTTPVVKRKAALLSTIPTAIVLAAFSIPAIPWMASSYIVGNYTIDLDTPVSLILPAARPSGILFQPVVQWVDSASVRQRRKLWTQTSELMYSIPLYAGERIATPFTLEVWTVEDGSTQSGTVASLASDLVLMTTKSRPFNSYDESGYESYTPTLIPTVIT